jgi:hypothetical protein
VYVDPIYDVSSLEEATTVLAGAQLLHKQAWLRIRIKQDTVLTAMRIQRHIFPGWIYLDPPLTEQNESGINVLLLFGRA